MYQARPFLLLLAERSLLHSKQIADVIEIVRFAVLLPDFLLDELIPVVNGKCLRRYYHFVPVRLYVIFLWRLGYVQSVELHSSCDFLFSFEDSQRHLKYARFVVSDVSFVIAESITKNISTVLTIYVI